MAVLLVVLCRVDGLSTWLYRGGFLLVAVLVTVSLASVVFVPTSPLARVLSLAPVVWLGRISYGVYLWHWPIDLFLNGDRTGLHGTPLLLLRLGGDPRRVRRLVLPGGKADPDWPACPSRSHAWWCRPSSPA